MPLCLKNSSQTHDDILWTYVSYNYKFQISNFKFFIFLQTVAKWHLQAQARDSLRQLQDARPVWPLATDLRTCPRRAQIKMDHTGCFSMPSRFVETATLQEKHRFLLWPTCVRRPDLKQLYPHSDAPRPTEVDSDVSRTTCWPVWANFDLRSRWVGPCKNVVERWSPFGSVMTKFLDGCAGPFLRIYECKARPLTCACDVRHCLLLWTKRWQIQAWCEVRTAIWITLAC